MPVSRPKRQPLFLHHTSPFTRFARFISVIAGHPAAFCVATMVIVVWAVSGPVFGFSDTWQLVINTSTTIVTFLMVFLIQNSQNRETEALHIKIDELIRAIGGAHNALLNLEDLEISDLDRIRTTYARLAEDAKSELRDLMAEEDKSVKPKRKGA